MDRNEQCIRYRFTLKIQEINLTLPFFCIAYVQWGRGSKKQTQQCQVLKTNQSFRLRCDQELSSEYSCTFDNQTRKPHAKESVLKIVLKQDINFKLGGEIIFNLAESIDNQSTQGAVEHFRKIQKCPNKQATIKFQVDYEFLGKRNRSAISKSPSTSHYSNFWSFNNKAESPRVNFSSHKEQECEYRSSKLSPEPSQLSQLGQISFTSQKSPPKSIMKTKSPRRFEEKTLKRQQDSMATILNQLHSKTRELTVLREEKVMLEREIQEKEMKSNEKLLRVMNELNHAEEEKKRLQKICNEINDERQEVFHKKKHLECLILQYQTASAKKQEFFGEELELLKKRNYALVEDNDRLKNEQFKVQKQLFDLEREFDVQITDPHQLSLREKSSFQSSILKFKEKVRELEQSVQSKDEQLIEEQQKYHELKFENDLLHEKYLKLEKESEKYKGFTHNAYEILLEKYETAQEQLSKTESLFEGVNAEFDGVEQEKNKEIQFMRKKFDSLRKKLDTYEEAEKAERQLGTELLEVKQLLLQKQHQFEEDNHQKDIRIKKLSSTIEDFENQMHKLQQEHQSAVKKFQIQFDGQSKRITYLEEERGQKETEIQLLRQQVTNAYAHSKKFSVGNFSSNRLKEQLTQANAKLEQKETALVELQSQCSTLSQENENMRNALIKMGAACKGTKQYEYQNEAKKLKMKVNSLEQTIREMVRKNIEQNLEKEHQRQEAIRDSVFSTVSDYHRQQSAVNNDQN